MSMDPKELVARQLKMDEGSKTHAYQDHNGYWTIGVGRNIDQRNGRGLRQSEIDFMLANDIEDHEIELSRVFSGWDGFSVTRKAALLNLRHQLGLRGIINFKLMVKAIEREDWVTAGMELRDSAMYRDPLLTARTERRARELTDG